MALRLELTSLVISMCRYFYTSMLPDKEVSVQLCILHRQTERS